MLGIGAGDHLTCFGPWFSHGQSAQAVGRVASRWETRGDLLVPCKCGGVQGTGSNGLCQRVGELQGTGLMAEGLVCVQAQEMSGGGLTNIGQFDGSTRRLWGLACLPFFCGLSLDLEQVTKTWDDISLVAGV